MKKCNTELMKELNALAEEKEKYLSFEYSNCTVSYLVDEEPVDNGYSYEATRAAIEEIEKKERHIKHLLSYSNATTKIDGYDMTISEALVYLAQLSARKRQMTGLSNKNPLTRSTVYDKIQYTKTLYDVNVAKEELKNITDEIAKLQMAIDRTNLTNMIECD